MATAAHDSFIEVKGRKFPVTLTNDLRLQVEVDGEIVSADNPDALRSTIATKLRVQRQDLSIPVVIRYGSSGGGYVRAVLRGKNSRTGWALMTINGKAEQVERPEIVARGDELGDEQLAELNRLLADESAARLAHAKYLRDVSKRHYLDDLLKAEPEV